MIAFGRSAITVAPRPTPNHAPFGPLIEIVATPAADFVGSRVSANVTSDVALPLRMVVPLGAPHCVFEAASVLYVTV